jgi:polyvinyl alcohol dehydrogenase (cytochrome)
MRYFLLAVLTAALAFGQDGAALYKERCAACHDAPQGHVPGISAIKAMSGEAIYAALTTGVMKERAAGLSTTDLFALIGYIAPTGAAKTATTIKPTCGSNPAFQVKAGAPQWNGWSPSDTNSRYANAAVAGLKASDIPKLKLKWAFNLGDVTTVRAQPTVVGGRVFLTTAAGVAYSLDAKTGCTYWGFQTAPGIRSGVSIGEVNGKPAAFFAEGGGTVDALNAQTGELLWKEKPVEHFAAIATGGPRFYKGVVYQGYSSFEEALGGDPKFHCCTFRGSVVALDANTGKKLWQTFTIPDAPKETGKSSAGTAQSGPSGAGIWSTPTIDEKAGVLYVATGDNYSDPATATSDAVLAMDLKTGELKWSKQLTSGDTYNNGCASPVKANCPKKGGPDFDFGQPPILVSLGGGKRALVIAQKSGMAYALDPDRNGEVLWRTQAGPGTALGGSQWGSASDGKNLYVAISNPGISGEADPKAPGGYRMVLDPRKGGGLHAIDLKTGKIVWETTPEPCVSEKKDCSPAQSAAVTAIPGAVFSGAVDGHLRAYSTANGKVLWDVNTAQEFDAVNGGKAHGGSMDVGGPAVVGGMVFVNSGYSQWGGAPGNAFLAYSVDGK